MTLNAEKQYKFGPDYFSINRLSSQKRNQLLGNTGTTNSILNFDVDKYLIQNVKKESDYLDSLKNYIKFSPDVAFERCVHLLPYNEKFYSTLYDVRNDSKKKHNSLRKLVHSLPIMHRCANTIKKNCVTKLPPVRVGVLPRKICDSTVGSLSDATSVIDPNNDTILHKDKHYWDEYLISLMSPGTAQYLAFEATHDESQAKRLQNLVQHWYGPAPEYRELIPDNTKDATNEPSKSDLRSTFPYKYYMDLVQSQRTNDTSKPTEEFNMDATPKDRIKDLLSRDVSFYSENQQTDPYGDETKAAFYRLPGLLRRHKKSTELVDKDSGNKTAENCQDYLLPSTPPRLLSTVLNPRVGDKILESDHPFHQDLLISTEINQKKLINEPDDVILIDNKMYRKSLQPVWPITVNSSLPCEDNLDACRPQINNQVKGHNRWTSLPTREETNLLSIEESDVFEEEARLESRKRVRGHSSVNLIVDQWRKKWQLTQKFKDSTTEALLKDMTDAHPTIRIQAIVTVAKSGSYATSLNDDIIDTQSKDTIPSDVIPKILLDSIEILLDDSHQQVRNAAAVALHSLEKKTEKSLKILRQMLGSGSSVNRWTAAQCLALSDVCDCHVISELVDQLMNSEDVIVHEKASILLAKISLNTKLVYGLLGEKLNTVSWRQRIIICKTLPLLHGSLNKDILRKLIYLMWQDPHKQVRIASSQAIGKTGNGKAVHEELVAKLQHQSEMVRSDALEKIGILKVMTTRLMPGFLKSFDDDFVVVRKEVCRACYRLAIHDNVSVKNLIRIARYDPSYQVKIYALRALGKIRVENPEIRQCFVWALLYEAETRVRFEALHSLLRAFTIDKDTVDVLKSRFLVEDDRHIIKLLRRTLNSVGINPDEDIDTVAEVKTEVRRFLSDKNHITDVILVNEAEESYAMQRELMLAPSPEDDLLSDNESDDELQGEDISRDLRVSFREVKDGRSNSSVNELEYKMSYNDDGYDDPVANDSGQRSVESNKNELMRESMQSENGGNIDNCSMSDKNDECNQRDTNTLQENIIMVEEFIKNDPGNEAAKVELNNEDESMLIEESKIDTFCELNTIENEEMQSTTDKRKVGFIVPNFDQTSLDVETLKKNTEETIDLCSYVLPADTSYVKVFSPERSMTWITLETPIITTDPSQLDLLESTISSSIMEMVNEAIEYEGIDCNDIE